MTDKTMNQEVPDNIKQQNNLYDYYKDKGNENTITIFIHLSGLILGFIIPLIFWIFERNQKSKIYLESKKALNFNITLFLIGVVTWFENHLPIPMPLGLLVFALGFFLILNVAYQISIGEESDYKLSYNFIK